MTAGAAAEAMQRDSGFESARVMGAGTTVLSPRLVEYSQVRPGEHRSSRHIPLPTSVRLLRTLLHAQSKIESRIVALQWVVMLLVGVGAVLPEHVGSGLNPAQSTLVLILLALHPIAYVGSAAFFYQLLSRNRNARVTVFTAIDVTVAIGVLFLTATKPGYTQVLLFSLVLLAATRYSLSRALSITSLLAVLQFFAILAANTSVQITTASSAIVAMFAMTYGVNQLSQAERKEAAGASENARLYEEVLLRNRELATINALTQSAETDTNPERMLESGMELILSSLTIQWGQAYSYQRTSDQLDLLFLRRVPAALGSVEDGRAEAERAARSRSVVIGLTSAIENRPVVRISSPVLVQGAAVGVLQAMATLPRHRAEGSDPSQSLSIACQELGSLLERATLREAAQRTLVLEEKNRIAHELHDTVLQLLFTSNLNVEWCLQQIESEHILRRKLGDIRRLVAQASDELRSAIFTLSSPVAEVGLLPALEQLSANFLDQYGLPVSFSASGQVPGDLPVLTQNALHRVVRESLMNVFKHAHATHAAVRLISAGETLVLVIQDDGIGLPPQVEHQYLDDSAHFGLRTVSRQIEQLEGQFEVHAGEDGGTIVRAMVPIHARHKRGIL